MTERNEPPDIPDVDDVDALLVRFAGITHTDTLPDDPQARWSWLRSLVEAHIERMMRHDVSALPQAMYRVDVDERAVEHVFATASRDTLAAELAQLVLDRLARTLRTRRRWEGLL